MSRKFLIRGGAKFFNVGKRNSTAVTSTVFENTTGLCGYISDEYLDGALWVHKEPSALNEK